LKEQEAIHALILGGTELPLILHDGMVKGVPFLDTTRDSRKGCGFPIMGVDGR
jgi:aspartate/glutamate racemase